jgi:ribosomal protein L37AE/L43A
MIWICRKCGHKTDTKAERILLMKRIRAEIDARARRPISQHPDPVSQTTESDG